MNRIDDWDRFNDQFRETTAERNARLRRNRIARVANPDPEWAEAQARAEYHAEEFDWERALGREEGDE